MSAYRAPVSPKTITAATLQAGRPDIDNLGITATKPRAAPFKKINSACTDSDSAATMAYKPKIKLALTPKVAPANKENMGATMHTSEVKATPDSDDIGTKIIDPAISHLSSHNKISPFQLLYDEEKKRANIGIATKREAERVRVQQAHEFTKKSQEAQKSHFTEFEGAHARGAHFSRAHRAPGNAYESNNRRHVVRAPPGDVEPSEWSRHSSVPVSRHQAMDAAHSVKVTRPAASQSEADPEPVPEQIQAERAFTKAYVAEIAQIRALRRQENKNETKAPKFPGITAQAVPCVIASTAEGVGRIENLKAIAEDALNKLQAARSIYEKKSMERGGHKVSWAAKDVHNQQRAEHRARNSLQPQVLDNAVDLSLILESDQVIGQNREVGAPVIQKDWGTYQWAVAASSEIVFGAINSGFGAGVVKKVADTLLDNKIEKRLYNNRKKRDLEGEPEIIDLPEHEELVCGEEWIVEDGDNLGGEEWEKL